MRISRQLVTLADDAPVTWPVADFAVRAPEPQVLADFLEAMTFRTLARRVAGDAGLAPAPAVAAPVEAVKIDPSAYACVRDLAALDGWVARAFEAGVIAFDTETDCLSCANGGLCGVSLAVAPGQACYIPLGHCAAPSDAPAGLDFTGPEPEAAADWSQLDIEAAIARLKPLLESPTVLKVAQNAKYDIAVLSRHGIDVAPIEDTMLMSYVLDAGLHGHGMDELSQLHLGHVPIPFKQVAGSGKKEISFAQVELATATAYAAERRGRDLAAVPRAEAAPGAREAGHGLRDPGAADAAGARRDGVRRHQGRSRPPAPALPRVRHQDGGGGGEGPALAGRPFNLGSPKQIGDVLFGEMGLPGAKRTATAPGPPTSRCWRTWRCRATPAPGDRRLAPDLQAEEHLRRRAGHRRGRPHRAGAHLLLAGVDHHRAAVVVGPQPAEHPDPDRGGTQAAHLLHRRAGACDRLGRLFQIELRLLAHIGDIPQLKDAFRQGLDIHAMTASEMFGVPIAGMDPGVRRRAKAINFGIVYGISAFGLSNQLGIPQDEAGAYIRTYFERFPGIRDYMDKTKAFVREHGYVATCSAGASTSPTSAARPRASASSPSAPPSTPPSRAPPPTSSAAP